MTVKLLINYLEICLKQDFFQIISKINPLRFILITILFSANPNNVTDKINVKMPV